MDSPLKNKSYAFAIRIVKLSQNEVNLPTFNCSLFTYSLLSKLYLKGEIATLPLTTYALPLL